MDKKKIMMLLFLLTATAIGAYAQGNGMAGINEATKMVTSYFDPGTKLIYAVGAVVGLIGGIKVYNKFSSGASLVVWQTFTMNRKYGQYGLMKKGAVRMHPRYLVNRRTVCHLIRNLQPKKAKK